MKTDDLIGTCISVPRSLFDEDAFPEEPFSRREAFLDLVQRAYCKPCAIPTKVGIIDIERGDQIVSIRMLSLRWGWSKSKVAKVLDEFEMQSRIRRKIDNAVTVVSINNYDVFQNRTDINGGGGNDNSNNTNTENKKPPTEAKARSYTRFVKPTVEEVRVYCDTNGYNIDSEQFVNFYESKGWVVGKSPMKSWKAAVRTWVNKDKASAKPSAEPTKPQKDLPPYEEAIQRAKNPTAEEKAKFWNEMVKPHFPKKDGETDEQYRERLRPIYHCQLESWIEDRVFRTKQRYL